MEFLTELVASLALTAGCGHAIKQSKSKKKKKNNDEVMGRKLDSAEGQFLVSKYIRVGRSGVWRRNKTN